MDTLKRYYDTHYWPDRATLIVAGDIPFRTLKEQVRRAFGDIPRSPHCDGLRSVSEPRQEGTRRVELARATPVRLITLSFKAPRFLEREWSALMLGLRHLTLGETSLLYKRLVDTRMASSVSAHLYPTKDPYLATISISVANRTSYDAIEQVVRQVIDEAARTDISHTRLALLKEHAYAEEIFSRDGSHAIATQLAEYVAAGDWQRYHTHPTEVQNITPEEVRDAIVQFCNPRGLTVGTITYP